MVSGSVQATGPNTVVVENFNFGGTTQSMRVGGACNGWVGLHGGGACIWIGGAIS